MGGPGRGRPLGLGVDPVPGGHLDGAVAGRAAQDDLAERNVEGVRVTPDSDNAMHNVEVIGGPPGTAYVAWQTSAPSQGYATYLQAFSTATGLVGTPK